MDPKTKKIFLIGGSLRAFNLFRLDLIKKILSMTDSAIYCIYWGNAESEQPQLIHPDVKWIGLEGSHLNPSIFSDIRPLTLLIKLLIKEKPTHLMAFNAKPIFFSSFIAACFHRSCYSIALLEGLGKGFNFLVKEKGNKLKKYAFRFFTQFFAKWIFLNERDKNLIVSLLPKRSTKSITVLNGIGVDVNYYSPLSPDELFKNKKIIFVGRLIPEKGIRVFIDVARILKQTNNDWSFAIAGFKVNESDIKQEEIDSWLEEGIIESCSAVSDMRAFYYSASILVLPSYYNEGLPATIMEAQSCGLPCLVNKQESLLKSIVDGKTGFFASHLQPQQWLEKIESLADFNHYQQFSYAAREYALAEFDQSSSTAIIAMDILSDNITR